MRKNVCHFLTVLMVVPPPSSDKRKWWLDHNASSKVEIPKPPGEGWILNPQRPKNPWDQTDEPDWIKVTAVQIPTSSPIDSKASLGTKVPPVPPPRRRQTAQSIPSPEVKPALPRRPSSASVTEKSKPPVPPKPTFIRARSSKASSPAPSDESEFKPAPPLPPKTSKRGGKAVEKNGQVGLLMDDDNGQTFVGSWKPLQPSKEL